MLWMPAFGKTTAKDWFDKGNALLNESKYDEAIEAYDMTLGIDPQYAEAWYNKGNALSQLGFDKHDESVQAYSKAIELDPKYADRFIFGIKWELIIRLLIGVLILGLSTKLPHRPVKKENGNLNFSGILLFIIWGFAFLIGMVFMGSAIEEITGVPIGEP
jgi:tetratricopeptide (TPR) repeat protein